MTQQTFEDLAVFISLRSSVQARAVGRADTSANQRARFT
jgi:hypothetical protein